MSASISSPVRDPIRSTSASTAAPVPSWSRAAGRSSVINPWSPEMIRSTWACAWASARRCASTSSTWSALDCMTLRAPSSCRVSSWSSRAQRWRSLSDEAIERRSFSSSISLRCADRGRGARRERLERQPIVAAEFTVGADPGEEREHAEVGAARAQRHQQRAGRLDARASAKPAIALPSIA